MASYVAKASNRLAGVMRTMGAALDGIGKGMEVTKYTEKLVPSTRFVAVNGVAPTISDLGTFVAPSASVVGDVTIGKDSSVWYGATLRGDVNKVSIGENTSVGDRAVVHVAKIQGNFPTFIGSNVTIGAGALVHAATVKDGSVIGEMAQILDGAVVEENAVVFPGSVVTPGTVVGSGELWSGSPAKKVRVLTQEEIATNLVRANETSALAAMHAVENAKDYKQLLEEEELQDIKEHFDDSAPRAFPDLNDVLGQGEPGRIFRSTLSHPEEAVHAKSKA